MPAAAYENPSRATERKNFKIDAPIGYRLGDNQIRGAPKHFGHKMWWCGCTLDFRFLFAYNREIGLPVVERL
jgi:hypothetical protein